MLTPAKVSLREALDALAHCDNNNDRYQALFVLRAYVLPWETDLAGIYPEVSDALVAAVAAARATEPKPVEGRYGLEPGRMAGEVTDQALETVAALLLVDISRSVLTLTAMFRGETEYALQRRIVQPLRRLARQPHDPAEGAVVQRALADILKKLPPEDRDAMQAFLVPVWTDLREFGGIEV